MRKVLVTGPDYFNFIQAVCNAFTELGWEVTSCSYDTPVTPYNTFNKVRYKLSSDKDSLKSECRRAFQRVLKARFEEFSPDLVFVMNGEMVEASTLELFGKTSKTAIWFFDTLKRLPGSESLAAACNAVFCYDREDAENLKGRGIPAEFLPQACDTSVYRPLALQKDIDILFIGNLYGSPKRKNTMLSIIEGFPKARTIVYGLYDPWYKGLCKWLKRPYKQIFKNRNLPPLEVNRMYNRAKVVLNIHQEQQTDGANPRFFEICGSGAYQICDANPYLKATLPEGSVGLYSTSEELFSLIDSALKEDKSAQAGAARQAVLDGHSFICRMRKVVETTFGG